MQKKLTDKQKRFAEELIKDMNATQAAIRAGYSKGAAASQGSRLKSSPEVAAYVSELLEQAKAESIATAEEVLQFATKLQRGELTEQRVIGIGNGAQNIESFKASLKDRLAAATLLAKYHDILTPKAEASEAPETVIVDGSGINDFEEEEIELDGEADEQAPA